MTDIMFVSHMVHLPDAHRAQPVGQATHVSPSLCIPSGQLVKHFPSKRKAGDVHVTHFVLPESEHVAHVGSQLAQVFVSVMTGKVPSGHVLTQEPSEVLYKLFAHVLHVVALSHEAQDERHASHFAVFGLKKNEEAHDMQLMVLEQMSQFWMQAMSNGKKIGRLRIRKMM